MMGHQCRPLRGAALAALGLPLVELETAGDRHLAALLEVLAAAARESSKGHDVDVDRVAMDCFFRGSGGQSSERVSLARAMRASAE